jgi:23S rRNA (cytidine1920-2'-O)/16S rRNA (cytidine1409-2'-O)-methyltransferase
VKGGLVTDAALRADAVGTVLWAAWDAGFGVLGVVSSPLPGTHGNQEYLAHIAAGRGTNPTEWLSTVSRLAGEGGGGAA